MRPGCHQFPFINLEWGGGEDARRVSVSRPDPQSPLREHCPPVSLTWETARLQGCVATTGGQFGNVCVKVPASVITTWDLERVVGMIPYPAVSGWGRGEKVMSCS